MDQLICTKKKTVSKPKQTQTQTETKSEKKLSKNKTYIIRATTEYKYILLLLPTIYSSPKLFSNSNQNEHTPNAHNRQTLSQSLCLCIRLSIFVPPQP